MKTASCKQKGRRLQQRVVKSLLASATHLTPRDIRSTSMGATGVDVLLSEAACVTYPFAIECKNTEKLNVHATFEEHAAKYDGSSYPLLVHSKNHSEDLVTLKWTDFLYFVRYYERPTP